MNFYIVNVRTESGDYYTYSFKEEPDESFICKLVAANEGMAADLAFYEDSLSIEILEAEFEDESAEELVRETFGK